MLAKTRSTSGLCIAALGFAALGSMASLSLAAPRRSDRTAPRVVPAQVPLSFEANEGQTDPRVRFVSRGPGYTLFLTPAEAVVSLATAPGAGPEPGPREASRAVLRLRPVGASRSPVVEGLDPLPQRSHYFTGPDPKAWRTGVRHYARVLHRDVYSGIDLVYHGRQGRLEYDFVVAPGADPSRIRIAFDGASAMRLTENGDLVLSAGGGEIEQRAPEVYQATGQGGRSVVPAKYVLTGPREVGFRLGDYDRSAPLVIDPVLVYSSYLGGSGSDFLSDVAVDASGHVYLAGYTTSLNFPGAPPRSQSDADAFVVKLNPEGTAIVFASYLGGPNNDIAYGVAVDASGNVYLAGFSDGGFPTVNAVQPGFGGIRDAFVSKLDTTGSSLVYSSYLGGRFLDTARGVAVDGQGNAHVVGSTSSADFPTANPFQPGNRGTDAFVTKLNAAGSAFVYSTYLGGGANGGDAAFAVAADAEGNTYVTGVTFSSDFPIANAVQPALRTYPDAFVTKLDPTGATLTYSTYLGGRHDDWPFGIAADTSGNAYVTGKTDSPDFPTAGASQPQLAGLEDAFLVKLAPAGALVFSRFLGGRDYDQGHDVAVDAEGNAYVTGRTSSRDFPLKDPFQLVNHGSSDAFVTKLSAAGGELLYSSYLGGSSGDYGNDIAVDGSGVAHVAGEAFVDFPVVNGLQPTPGGMGDLFVATVEEGPSGIPVEPVVWTEIANATAEGNALRKTSGCEGCDDAGGVSFQKIVGGDAYVEFSVSEGSELRVIGLSHASATTSAGEIDYGILLGSPGVGGAGVYENGVYQTDTNFEIGDRFRIEVGGVTVTYHRNGVVFYTSRVPPEYPLVLDASLFNLGGAVTDAVIAGKLDTGSTGGTGQSPYSGQPFAVPGLIPAEDFDRGGEGVAYHDRVAGNAGGLYRPTEDVDIISPYEGGLVVNNFETGEWIEYTISVAEAGVYSLEALVSSELEGSRWHVEIDGVDVTGPVTAPNTGSWKTFEWVGKSGVTLAAGEHVLRIHSEQEYFNLDALRVGR